MVELADLEQRLNLLVRNRPDLTAAADLQRELLRQTYAARPNVAGLAISDEQAQAKLAQGVPLLHQQELDVDLDFSHDLFGRLLNTLQARPDSAEIASRIAHAAASGSLDFERALGEALANHIEHLYELAVWAGASPEGLASVMGLVAQPTLQAMARALRPLLADNDGWQRGFCPTCGAWAGLAELQMAEQHRHLRCLRCGSDWRARRLMCAFCGNDDHRTLGYLQVDRELRFRVETCEACKGYLKLANAFEPAPPEGLVLDDLVSIHLDVAALERGYSRPEGAGFRLELVGEGAGDLPRAGYGAN